MDLGKKAEMSHFIDKWQKESFNKQSSLIKIMSGVGFGLLAFGALALSLVFVKGLLPIVDDTAMVILFSSWIMVAVGSFITASTKKSHKQRDDYTYTEWDNAWAKYIPLIVGGILLLIVAFAMNRFDLILSFPTIFILFGIPIAWHYLE